MTGVAQPYPYKTQPLPKQREALLRSANQPFFALFMEQGTGKSKVTIDTMGFLYRAGKIDGAVIIAPNGVHYQWVLDQLPTHMSDTVPWRAHVWRSGNERALWHKREKHPEQEWAVSQLAQDRSVLAVLVVNSEALTVPLCHKAVGTFLTRRKCLMVVDEVGSSFTKPSAKRSRALMRWWDQAPYRRVLEGVPAQNPFELYVPMRFLHWRILGYKRFADMKENHADWVEVNRGTEEQPRIMKFLARRADGTKAYKDIDRFRERMAPYIYRCTKAEALPDLPPKIYHKRYFAMTSEQQRLTRELMEDFQTTLGSGETVTAAHKLTLYLRYQQIASGYVPPDVVWGDDSDKVQPVAVIDGPNPRLQIGLEEAWRHRNVPQIIWCRFHYDVDLLRVKLHEAGHALSIYDGRMSVDEKEDSKQRFLRGDSGIFLANTASGGTGQNLYVAEAATYYTNYFGLRRRLQSEDRNHRMGTKTVVNYTDILALNSIDMLIVRALRGDHDVADLITGDPAKDWI